MPVDYSKWDALELSDDSDIEVHPNVDKRSFIRAKQNQIHQQRFERKNKTETYKYERIVNDGLLKRINSLLAALQSHSADTEKRSPDEIMFQAIMETVGDLGDDAPPPPPAGVHTQEKDQPTYSKMMAALVDQVKAKVDADKPENRYEAYVAEVKSHQAKVEGLQKQLLEELNNLEQEEGKKITSENIHTGFDSSHVNKAKAGDKPAGKSKKPAQKEKTQTVEVLNPKALASQGSTSQPDGQQSSGVEADIDEPLDDEVDIQPSDQAKQFAAIKAGDYRTCLEFISKHPEVVAEKETDALLVLAFDSCIEGAYEIARQCVHQGLLLQYCRALGRDGVGLFFKRITTPGHQAQKVFYDDVNSTFARIKSRAIEIEKQRAQELAEGAGVEQIQLHAVDPNTTINIQIPPEKSEDPAEISARELFNGFSPGLQRALENKSLDEVNTVLGKMSVEEAEDVVAKLGEGGMLSLEEQIIDATTEEGQQALKDFEEQEKAAQQEQTAEQAAVSEKYADDPE